MDHGYQQKEEDSAVLPNGDQYQSLVGGLLYIAVNSRPDVSISASFLGRSVSQPRVRDWTEAKRVLRYLYNTRSFHLKLGATDSGLEVFCDADWAGDTSDRKSTSGFLIFLGGGIVSWASRKESFVALSSTESEFIALAKACQEVQWLRKLLKDLGKRVDQGPEKEKCH
ncbi:hypothetical protein RP20_CCG014244 [Aedes albopictus]|nr:hypothetical protein RP20_CCG014244 [Aedes albopictus]